MTEDELDLVETDDLIDALARRFAGLVLVTMKDLGETEGTCVYWRGGRIQAIGLLHEGIEQMNQEKSRHKDPRD